MATHICRDFISLNMDNAGDKPTPEGHAAYFLIIFMIGTLGWSVAAEGSSDFGNLAGAGVDFGSGNSFTGSSSVLVSSGTGGSLNLGPGQEWQFEPPSGSHRFDVFNAFSNSGSCADVGRILVLRSTDNPAINSGLFRITQAHPATGGLNLDITCDGNFASGALSPGQGCTFTGSLSIDYRSSQYPPVESGSLTWYIFQGEGELFDGGGTSLPQPPAGQEMIDQIVLQSPSSSWQLRLAQEDPSTDGPDGAVPARVSMAPGFGADSNANFPIAGEHLHAARWFDTNEPRYAGGVAGLEFVDDDYVGTTTPTGSIRAYMWGRDDNGLADPGSVVVVWRNGPSSSLRSTWRAFGFCETEPPSLPDRAVQRMFAMGGSNYTQNHSSSIQWNTTMSYDLENGSLQDSGNTVVGFGTDGRPQLGNISTWCFLSSQNKGVNSTPRRRSSAPYPSASAFTGQFELLPCDVMVGTWDTRVTTLGRDNAYTLGGRRLGVFPSARYGVESQDSGHSDWAITDDTLWLHTEKGIYLPWSGTL